MKAKIIDAVWMVMSVVIVVLSLSVMLNYTGITITIGKQQKPEIFIYPQGSQEQRL